jgi:hypothetical protein
MEKVENGMVSVGIRAGTVVIVRVDGKTSGLLDKSGEIILPVEVIGGLEDGRSTPKMKPLVPPLFLSRSS